MFTITEADSVAATTFIPWKDTFPYRGFLKTRLAYCPHCYDADGDDPYERLLWSLASVPVCPVHPCRLLENCPRCGMHIPAITYKSNPSRCPFDDSSLKDASHLTPIGSVALNYIRAFRSFLEREPAHLFEGIPSPSRARPGP